MNTILSKCTQSDLSALIEISWKTYDETFRPYNPPDIMDQYLNDAFQRDKMVSELSNSSSEFYFIYMEDSTTPAGYLKINEAPAQSELKDPASLEIERIYILKEYHKLKLGQTLMDFALSEAKKRAKTYVWLGVWEKNERALAFYQKNGFYQVGSHSFFMGDDEQTDYLLRKNLQETDVI